MRICMRAVRISALFHCSAVAERAAVSTTGTVQPQARFALTASAVTSHFFRPHEKRPAKASRAAARSTATGMMNSSEGSLL